MATQFYIKQDIHTDEPVALYRWRDQGDKSAGLYGWNRRSRKWELSARTRSELDGLGGAVEFSKIGPGLAERVQRYLNGDGPDPTRERGYDYDHLLARFDTDAQRKKLHRSARRRGRR